MLGLNTSNNVGGEEASWLVPFSLEQGVQV